MLTTTINSFVKNIKNVDMNNYLKGRASDKCIIA